jgi:ribosomal protein S27AE
MSNKSLVSDVNHSSKEEKQEDWWEFCPVCGSRLLNHKCRFVCSNPRCHFFMSCSEFDM